MKLNVDLKNISFAKKLKGNVSLLLWVFLGVMALLVGWIIFREIQRVTVVGVDNNAVQSQVVRIDQAKHQRLQKMLDDNSHFVPKSVPHAEVFSAPPAQKSSQ